MKAAHMCSSLLKQHTYFLAGVALGLWAVMVAVPKPAPSCAVSPAAPAPPPLPAPVRAPAPARAPQRPRYYHTELGMRAPLLPVALCEPDQLEERCAALNATMGSLRGTLRVLTRAAHPAAPPRPNLVAFTDPRAMLTPFHALKYLADNHLDDYDFFFLAGDETFVNSRRLREIVSRLSVAHPVYMGLPSAAEPRYCELAAGVLLSNAVLRAVHAELEWCVRNSYSPHHHENVGRCVLHAARLPCTAELQGERYTALRLDPPDGGLVPALADAVTAYPVVDAGQFHRLHAYVSRLRLRRAARQARVGRQALKRALRRWSGLASGTPWPPGQRCDPAAPFDPPSSRFDHTRWTLFNGTHAFMPDDHHAVAPLTAAYQRALQLVMREVRAWASHRWEGGGGASLVEGALRWEAARGVTYRLLLKVGHGLRGVQAARGLAAATLAPVPYVTESARLWIVLPVPAVHAAAAPAALRRYAAVALRPRARTALLLVIVAMPGDEPNKWGSTRAVFEELKAAHPGAALSIVEAALPKTEHQSETALLAVSGRVALTAASRELPRDALVLLLHAHLEYNEEFLNRVRMNSVAGVSWYAPVPFARYEQYAHPKFVDADGRKPQQNTGRFNAEHWDVVGFHRADYETALSLCGERDKDGVSGVLARCGPRVVRAPEPACVSAPRGVRPQMGEREGDRGLSTLDLGQRASLARLLLETKMSEAAAAA